MDGSTSLVARNCHTKQRYMRQRMYSVSGTRPYPKGPLAARVEHTTQLRLICLSTNIAIQLVSSNIFFEPSQDGKYDHEPI
jgi:hypothetical protein